MKESAFFPAALTIAGSDSGGGAGIQADLRTFTACGVFGCSAIAALTAQNPFEVAGIQAVPPEFILLQMRECFKGHNICAVKTGMLFSAPVIEQVSAELAKHSVPLVVDPVMIATSGARLLEGSAIEAVKRFLLPRADWMTPNIPEAEELSGMQIRTTKDMETAARICAETFGCSVVLKGGHLTEGRAADVVVMNGTLFTLETERLELPSKTASHGTGCTFSSALAAFLARGLSPEEAVRKAKKFVFLSLRGLVRTAEKTWCMFPPSPGQKTEGPCA